MSLWDVTCANPISIKIAAVKKVYYTCLQVYYTSCYVCDKTVLPCSLVFLL